MLRNLELEARARGPSEVENRAIQSGLAVLSFVWFMGAGWMGQNRTQLGYGGAYL